jgi:hypothetical protein
VPQLLCLLLLLLLLVVEPMLPVYCLLMALLM